MARKRKDNISEAGCNRDDGSNVITIALSVLAIPFSIEVDDHRRIHID